MPIPFNIEPALPGFCFVEKSVQTQDLKLRCHYIKYLLENPLSRSLVFCNVDLQARMFLQQVRDDIDDESKHFTVPLSLHLMDRMVKTSLGGWMKFMTADLGRPVTSDDNPGLREIVARCQGYELNAIFTDELHVFHRAMIIKALQCRIRR